MRDSLFNRQELHRFSVLTCRPGGNIGNAKLEGSPRRLGSVARPYNWCSSQFSSSLCGLRSPQQPVRKDGSRVGHRYLTIVETRLLKKLRPSRWPAFIMVAWGLVTTLMGIRAELLWPSYCPAVPCASQRLASSRRCGMRSRWQQMQAMLNETLTFVLVFA